MTATVLAIDDCPVVLSTVAARLRAENVQLVTATEWETGLALAIELRPDLVLLDIELPSFSGLDLCRRLKEDPRTRDIPVIFLTAATEIATKLHGFDLGAVDYVTKPFNPDELRARVRAALRAKRAQDVLVERARVDALTGLHNRSHLDERLAAETRQAHIAGTPLCFVLLDLDHFKRINDLYGHPFGDRVLASVGELLARSIRPGDLAFRYGGEELALLLPGVTLEQGTTIAERVRDQLRTMTFVSRGEPVNVTASFGVVEASEMHLGAEASSEAFVTAADEALYAAKSAGRDRVGVWRRSGITISAPLDATVVRRAS